MSEIPIETSEIHHIGGTPYAGFAVRAHAALIEDGLSDPADILVDAQHRAIVARVGEEPVGILTFIEDTRLNSVFVCVAFVVPDYRRRRIFGLMYEELIKAAERLGASRIEAITATNNVVFPRAADRVGMRRAGSLYRMDLSSG